MTPTSRILKTILPWVAAAFLLTHLFRIYPAERLLQATSYLHPVPFLIYSVAYFLYMWLADCWSLAKIFSRSGSPTRPSEFLKPRLASYAVTLINYGAGQGALAYILKKKKNLSFLRSTSLIAFTTLIDIYWTITFAFAGSVFSDFVIEGINLKKTLWALWLTATGCLGCLIACRKMLFLHSRLERILSRNLFAAFRETSLKKYLAALAFRLPLHLGVYCTFYFVVTTFGATIPFLKVLTYLPIVILIGTIPITPGGLGTTQIASVEFFKNEVTGVPLLEQAVSPPELIFLMTLSFQAVNYILKAVLGSAFISKSLFEKANV